MSAAAFNPLLWSQWKVSRWAVLVLLPLCLGLPIVVVRFARQMAGGPFSQPALDMINAVELWVPIFPLLAAVTGCTLALCAWLWDHNTNHVYALSLPIERWRYALMKFLAGAAVLLLPAAAIWLGAIFGVSTTTLPEGLHSYPISFGFRFLLASLICYAITFAFAAGTIRTTVRIITALFVLVVFGTILTDYVGSALGEPIPSPLDVVVMALTSWPGPFNVLGGSWMLIDV